MTKKTKEPVLIKWVKIGIKEKKKWDTNPKSPLNTAACLQYLYERYAYQMFEDGLTLNDIFYEARFYFKKIGITGRGKNRK
jgi:hypothetical protein